MVGLGGEIVQPIRSLAVEVTGLTVPVAASVVDHEHQAQPFEGLAHCQAALHRGPEGAVTVQLEIYYAA